MIRKAVLALFVYASVLPVAAQTTEPLSAIDWLSKSVAPAPATTSRAPPRDVARRPAEAPVTNSATSPLITVTTLDGATSDPVGLLPQSVTGLPPSLWENSTSDTLVTLVQAQNPPRLPAISDLLKLLLLAQANPPQGHDVDAALFLARVDKLLDMGALPQAQALLEAAGPDTPDLFRRWFDVALLTGTEDEACAVMQSKPSVAPTYPARIFCLARTGNWPAAALTLNTHIALGDVTDEEQALLSRFLEPEFAGDPLSVPSRISPLTFRMREAIGESLPTSRLPIAFAYADLRDTTGLKGQLDAAERLSRHAALPAPTLSNLFLSRKPSASGGVWDRVKAYQRFDAALRSKDADRISTTLPPVWEAMQSIGAEALFAENYGDALQAIPLTGRAKAISGDVGLLGPTYQLVAAVRDDLAPFARTLAQGTPKTTKAASAMASAIAAAFDPSVPAPQLAAMVDDGKLGEALLRTIAQLDSASVGDLRSLTDAFALLRYTGFEDSARRIALQMLLLDRPT